MPRVILLDPPGHMTAWYCSFMIILLYHFFSFFFLREGVDGAEQCQPTKKKKKGELLASVILKGFRHIYLQIIVFATNRRSIAKYKEVGTTI